MVAPEECLKEFVEVTQPKKSFEGITNIERSAGDVHIHFEMGANGVTETCYAMLTEDDDGYTVDEFEIQGENENSSESTDRSGADSPVERLQQYLETTFPESDLDGVTNLEREGDYTHIHLELTDDNGTTQYYAMITEDGDDYLVKEFETV